MHFLSGNFPQTEIRPRGEQLEQRRVVDLQRMRAGQRPDFPLATPDDTGVEQAREIIPAKLAAVELDRINSIGDGHE